MHKTKCPKFAKQSTRKMQNDLPEIYKMKYPKNAK